MIDLAVFVPKNLHILKIDDKCQDIDCFPQFGTQTTCSTSEMGIMTVRGRSAVLHIRKQCLVRQMSGICSTAGMFWRSLNSGLSVLHVSEKSGVCIPGYVEGIQYGYRKQLLDLIAKANTIKSE